MTANEDFLFAQEALAQGFVTDAQVEEALLLQKRMSEELKIDERVGVILVKRGWLAEDQARRIQARIAPPKGEPGEIHGYRLLEIVGRGAMGTVYRAVHTGLNRTVAIKILRQDLANDRTQVERLKAEAAMLASLDHPNIVRALDAGESNGFPYVVMEFVEGETLRDRMRREGPLPEATALGIARGVADALERARRMGVVHRDVKPGNILLTRAGVPKLMDLGLAKGPIDLGLTQHGSTVGTPQYIAPEQAVDPRKADTRSDIYALGATLYAMLTGRPPFDGQTLAEILTKVLYETPLPVRTLRPEISAETGYLVERMMLRDPSLRYRTPALVVEDIDRLTGGNSILPKGFSGNWEAFLLKRRWRRLLVVVPTTVAIATLLALGARWYLTRATDAEQRKRIEAAGGQFPTVVPVSDTREDVERRLRDVREMLTRARRSDAANWRELGASERAYLLELQRFAELDRAEPAVVAALARGRYREADDILAKTSRAFPVEDPAGPARRVCDERRHQVRADSDARLEDARREHFAMAPRDASDLVAAVEGWMTELEDRFAKTPAREAQQARAALALDVAREVSDTLGKGIDVLSDDVIRRRVDSFEFAAFRRDVEAVRAKLERVRDSSGRDHLVLPRYVLVEAFDALLGKPIDHRVEVFESAVGSAWTAGQRRAGELVARGEFATALEIYERFVRAASENEAFADIAQAARRKQSELESSTRAAFDAAEKATTELAATVAAALERRDIASVVEALRAARARPDVFSPLPGRLESFDGIPGAWDRLLVRALDGLAARVGEARDRWIAEMRFEGGVSERALEIKAVDPGKRTFTYVGHSGGLAHNPQTRSVTEVSVDDLRTLAGLSPEVPSDAFTLALHAFSGLVLRSDDPYVVLDAFGVVVERLGRANALESPLGVHVRLRAAKAKAEIDRLEEVAATELKSAETRMAQSKHSAAYGHLKRLLDPPLRYTRLVRDNEVDIRARRASVLADADRDNIEIALNGAHVERRSPAGGGLDVTVTFSFDTPEQLRNFTSGWARIVNPGSKRVVTPDPNVTDQSLLLLPDSTGEIVRDRPLVLPTFLDPNVESSMSFEVWPLAPFLLALDLDGVQVAILSADPQEIAFPPDVPRLDAKEDPPRFDHYGRGRGVRFHAAPEMGDPSRWGWGEEFQGRAFVPPKLAKREKELLATRWFAFEKRSGTNLPYRVKFVRLPGRGARLEIDGATVLEAGGEPFKSQRPSGKIQILTYTRCLIDDLQLTGRVSAPWFERITKSIDSDLVAPSPAGGRGKERDDKERTRDGVEKEKGVPVKGAGK